MILIPSETDDRVPSVMYVTEIIGDTEAKQRAGIEGTTARVYESFHCGARGEVVRSNVIYLDEDGLRVTLESIRETNPRLYEIANRTSGNSRRTRKCSNTDKAKATT